MPALAHGASTACNVAPGAPIGPPPTGRPEREVTRAVTTPLPTSGWCTNMKLSVTGSPPGPVGTAGCLDVQDDRPVGQNEKRSPDALTNERSAMTRAAAPRAITDPRTVLNFVHSAQSSGAKPSWPTG